MTEEQINRVYIRSRLRRVTQDCFITDALLHEVYEMLKGAYAEGLKQGKLEKQTEKINTLIMK